MRRVVVLTAFLIVAGSSVAKAELVDPFVNPVKRMIQAALLKAKEESKAKSAKVKTVSLFKPAIPKPFQSMSLQGIIVKDGTPYLVLMDPETGQVFFLKEGDAVSADTKIVSITGNEIILEKYYKYRGALRKKRLKVKVDLGV